MLTLISHPPAQPQIHYLEATTANRGRHHPKGANANNGKLRGPLQNGELRGLQLKWHLCLPTVEYSFEYSVVKTQRLNKANTCASAFT
jgi:hypothetical protein